MNAGDLARRVHRVCARDLELPDGVKVWWDDGLCAFITGDGVEEPLRVTVRLRRSRDGLHAECAFDPASDGVEAEVEPMLRRAAMALASAQ
jgi:hypothetical protein